MIKEFLKETTEYEEKIPGYKNLKLRPRIICKDGFSMSVQASQYHYCEPREDLDEGDYTEVEVGLISQEEELLEEYAEDHDDPITTLYCFVPLEVIDEVIAKHGGLGEERQ